MCESFPVFTRVVHIDILAMLKTGHNQNLKDCPYGSGQPDDLLVLATVYEVVNSLPEKAWIEQSDAHIIQNAVQIDCQLLGKTSSIGAWERERHRDRKGGIVGGGGDVLRDFSSALCTAIVHQSVREAKPVRRERRFPRNPSLSPGMPQEEIQA